LAGEDERVQIVADVGHPADVGGVPRDGLPGVSERVLETDTTSMPAAAAR
jgi:hypothetical protein